MNMNPSQYRNVEEGGERIDLMPLNVVESLERAAVDIQVATAKQWPRDVEKFKRDTEKMALVNPEVAKSCYYGLPRDGKVIEGPSIRLAEIAASNWMNIRWASMVVGITEDTLTARGIAWDLEKNNAASSEVQIKITNKSGKRFPEHMIVTTANAACAKAARNAIFKVIPVSFIQPIWEKCKLLATGGTKPLPEKQTIALAYCLRVYGVDQARVFAALHITTLDEFTEEKIADLSGFCQSIKDSEATIDSVFPIVAPEPPPPPTTTTTAPPAADKPAEPQKPSDPAQAMQDTLTGMAQASKGRSSKQQIKQAGHLKKSIGELLGILCKTAQEMEDILHTVSRKDGQPGLNMAQLAACEDLDQLAQIESSIREYKELLDSQA